MKDDISTALLAFYGKVLEPEFRSIKEKQSEHDEKFTRLLDHIDAVYQRLERLEEEYHLIVHGIEKLEDRMQRLEGRMERIEKAVGTYKPDKLQQEIASMKTKLSDLQKRLEQLEKRVAGA